MGLSVRHFDYNNVILDMLSAPNNGLAVPHLRCLQWKTAVANVVIDNMKENDGIYIPINLQKDVLPIFYIDNTDWLEDGPDRKNTSNYLQMSIFQRKIQELLPIKLKIKKEETESLKVKSNSFNEILPYLKPNKSQFQQSPGCDKFCQSLDICPTSLFDIWISFRFFERIMFENNTSLQSPPRESICSVSIKIVTEISFRHHQC